jgi:hypothetical protein
MSRIVRRAWGRVVAVATTLTGRTTAVVTPVIRSRRVAVPILMMVVAIVLFAGFRSPNTWMWGAFPHHFVSPFAWLWG